jgi:poly-gamma-glutamate capsule biosynthesis protein CapA/YwtB (metallophosphatase superfamily)
MTKKSVGALSSSAFRPFALVASFVVLLAPFVISKAGLGQNAIAWPPPATPRDQNIELAMKIKQPFTLVAVGDMLQMVPLSKSDDPDLQFLMNLMRGADMTDANNENTVLDTTTFTGRISHMETPAVVADDWANMGIKMMTKANNHTFDDGDDGVWDDFKQLDRVGIVHVGVGRNMTEARLAHYVSTPKGIVGLVGVYANNINPSQLNGSPRGVTIIVSAEQLTELRAMRDSIVARRNEVGNPIVVPPPDPEGETSVFGLNFKVASASTSVEGNTVSESPQARSLGTITSKINTLGLTTYNGVTSAQMAQLRAIAGDRGTGNNDTLSVFGVDFRVTPGPGEYHYDIDQQDERDILREVRTGKQFSDFEVATIHWHQNRFAFQHYSFDHYPADFEIRFAHDCIDQGADAFIGHGVHTIKGVEIYKGKPIFYGVSNFVMQQQIFASWRDRGAEPPTPLTGPIVGEGEVNEIQWAWMQRPDNFEGLLASMHYENGRLTEVRIYPVDEGLTPRPGSQLGIPRRPTPEIARQILEHVVEYSKPFGTKIVIENGVGIIHIPQVQQ